MIWISYFPISVTVEASKMHFRDLLKIAGHKNKAMAMHEKPYLLFPNVLKRWSFQKNRTGIWSFLYYQYFFFPIICSYSLDTKGKMIFLKKNTWKYDLFFKCSEKMVFPKNWRLNTTFFVTSGRMVFIFSRKYDIFSLGGKWKMIFNKNAWEYDIFGIYA